MKKRNGVILFVTLMMMLLFMGVVSLFLNKTKESKDSSTIIYAMIQTNSIMDNLVGYIKNIEFDEYTIMFASQAPFPLSLGETNIVLKLDSAQKHININSFLKAATESKEADSNSDKFILLLLKYKIEEPNLFLDLLKDTYDTNKEGEEEERSNESEIILEYPTFRNGRIYNENHLSKIVDYYFEKTGDNEIYEIPFDELFSYTTNSVIDINFLSLDLMEILFDDANYYSLKTINEYDDIYEEIDDLPFDEYYTKKINKGMLGQTITTETKLIKVSATLNYKTQFKSKISFMYNTNSKNIFDYKIEDIVLINE